MDTEGKYNIVTRTLAELERKLAAARQKERAVLRKLAKRKNQG